MGCSVKCWTPIECPSCNRELTPRGRSRPLEMGGESECCEQARIDGGVNPRHLWDEHDSTRYYTDPEGWDAHVKQCALCVM